MPVAPPCIAARDARQLFFHGFAAMRRRCEREEHHLLAGHGADVVVQAHYLHAGNAFVHGFHERPSRFDEMCADLFEQISAFLGQKGLDEVLLGGGHNSVQSHHHQVVQQMRPNILGPRPMCSCSKRVTPSQIAASISPCVFIVSSLRHAIFILPDRIICAGNLRETLFSTARRIK